MEAKNINIHFSMSHFGIFAFHSIFYYAHFREVSYDQIPVDAGYCSFKRSGNRYV
jgi:hypothetical protein